MNCRFVLIVFTLLAPCLGRGKGFDETKVLAPQYAGVSAVYDGFSETKKEQIKKSTSESLSGISAVHPMPYVLSASEKQFIDRGVWQISNAIRFFFEDHFTGRKSYVGQNVIPENVLSSILSSYTFTNRMIKPGSTAFVVGPDIVRTRDGFKLLEVNVAGHM